MWADRLGSRKRTILIVEHDQVIRRLLSDFFGRDYHVLQAASPEEAVRLAAQQRWAIDLLLTETRLPNLFGWQLMDLLMLDYPKLKVIYISKSMDPETRSHTRRQKVLILQPPFLDDCLRQAVREALENPRPRRVGMGSAPGSLYQRLQSYFKRSWMHRSPRPFPS